MSLRVFHVAFIVVSIALSVVVAAWGVREFVQGGGANPLLVGLVAALSGAALVVYGIRYFGKLQELG